jgi:hypothetical protein
VSWNLVIAMALAASAVLYTLGLRRLWRAAGPRHGIG